MFFFIVLAPGITRVLAVSPRSHNDYQIPVAIIHTHYLGVKVTFVAACITLYFEVWVPSALLKVFNTSLLLFQC